MTGPRFGPRCSAQSVPNGTNFTFNGLVLKTGTFFTDVAGWSLKGLYGVNDYKTFNK